MPSQDAKDVIQTVSTSLSNLGNIIIGNILNGECINEFNADFFEHHIGYHECFSLMLAADTSIIPYGDLWKLDKSPELRRKFCLAHLQLSQQWRDTFDTLLGAEYLVCEEEEHAAACREALKKARDTAQNAVIRASREVAQPAFRVAKEELCKWHLELRDAMLATLWHEARSLVPKELVRDRRLSSSAKPPEPQADKASSVDKWMSSLKKRYANILKSHGDLVMAANSKFKEFYVRTKYKDVFDDIKTYVDALEIHIDTHILSLAGGCIDKKVIEEMESSILIHRMRLETWVIFSEARPVVMWEEYNGSYDEESPILKRQYCIDYLKAANDLLNLLDTVCSQPNLAPIAEATERVQQSIRAAREAVGREIARATDELSLAVITRPRLDLSAWQSDLAEVVKLLSCELAGALKFEKGAAPIAPYVPPVGSPKAPTLRDELTARAKVVADARISAQAGNNDASREDRQDDEADKPSRDNIVFH